MIESCFKRGFGTGGKDGTTDHEGETKNRSSTKSYGWKAKNKGSEPCVESK